MIFFSFSLIPTVSCIYSFLTHPSWLEINFELFYCHMLLVKIK